MSNEKRERIIDKVLKVLELSKNNPNPEEAKAAALKAQALMAEYHIEVDDLESITSTVEEITETRSYTGTGLKWKYKLASIIARNFRCRVYYSGKRFCVFYGYKTDTEIARSVFEQLLKIGHKLGLKERARVKKDGFQTDGIYNSYVLGFCKGVDQALSVQCTALMLVVPKEVNEQYEEMSSEWKCKIKTGLTISGDPNGSRAYYKGVEDGKDVAGKKRIK